MTDKRDKKPHNFLPGEHGRIDAVHPESPAAPAIPNGFGIWQLTASFRFPSAMPSVLCSDRLPRSTRSALTSSIQQRRHDYSKDQKAIFDQLAEAEGRLRLTFAFNQPFTLLPIYNKPTSAEELSPTLRRQTITLLSAEPFTWISPRTSTSFSFCSLGSTEFFNDFLLQPNPTTESRLPNALSTALFDVAAIVADRRSHMMAQGLAQRTYNVFLPPATIHEVAVPSRTYIVIPVLSFIRLSSKSCFRRTFSLSLVIIPVSKHTNAPRSLDQGESAALQSGWTLIPESGIASYSVTAGGLSTFLARRSAALSPSSQSILTLRELLQDVLVTVADNVVNPNRQKRDDALFNRLSDLVVRAVQASICGGCCSVISDVSASELRRWQANPAGETAIDNKLNQAIIGLIDPEPTRQWATAEPSAFRLHHGRGAEPLIPTFYFSFGVQRLVFTPSAPDLESRDASILWVIGWHLLLMTGISALLEMLGTFHNEMEHRPTAVSAQAFLKEFLVDLEEYFDFDLLSVYRLEFDALKKVEGIDSDFDRLRERVTALGQERIIEESRKINQRLLWIAIASFLVSVALLILTFSDSLGSLIAKWLIGP